MGRVYLRYLIILFLDLFPLLPPRNNLWIVRMSRFDFSEVLSAQSVLESVEDIASAEETPVSELAQKVLNQWSSLREAYRIPRKERIQQMKEHEREADQNVVKPRPRRLPLYAEKMRDRYGFHSQ